MTIKVFDFFSGCGGASKGMRESGLDPVFALDFDRDSRDTYTLNFPGVEFYLEDIKKLNVSVISDVVASQKSSPILFCGCAPCQPFTRQNTAKKEEDDRVNLLMHFLRFIEAYLPEYIFVENVPGVQKAFNGRASLIERFIINLETLGYFIDAGVIAAQSYGVPQRRQRFTLVASRLAPISLPAPTHGPGLLPYETVAQWISHLPPIRAGETHPLVPNHRAANLSELNLERIRATPLGGSWRDWPDSLKLECHTKRGYRGHSDVYGRMKWSEPASGLTTRCVSLSNGRFGHPEQDRAVSVREAACLQTFPVDFIFRGSLASMARQIGNAVPVKMARAFGENFLKHYAASVGDELSRKKPAAAAL